MSGALFRVFRASALWPAPSGPAPAVRAICVAGLAGARSCDPRNSAARRGSPRGLSRTTAQQHAHDREPLAPPLRRTSEWPKKWRSSPQAGGIPAGRLDDRYLGIPPSHNARFAVDLLFGGSGEDGYFIADAGQRALVGQIPSLFAAAFEAGHSAPILTWSDLFSDPR
jgi:hypothetical protein